MNKYFNKDKAGFAYANPMLYGVLKEHAKSMRNNPTDAEKHLWGFLMQGQLGVPFRRQHIIKDFIVDFACLPAKLIIEVDGGYHDELRQKYHDELRTMELEHLGFHIIRFSNEDVLANIQKVLEQIKEQL